MTPAGTAHQEPSCPECGGNCDPECGRHPEGCFYGAVVWNEWGHLIVYPGEDEDGEFSGEMKSGPAPKCKLKHPNVARLLAKDFMRGFFTVRVKVLGSR